MADLLPSTRMDATASTEPLLIPKKPADLACPKCHAGPLQPCEGDLTHRERAEAWSRAQPRPEPARPTCYDEEPAEPVLPENRGGGKQVTIG